MMSGGGIVGNNDVVQIKKEAFDSYVECSQSNSDMYSPTTTTHIIQETSKKVNPKIKKKT